MFPSSPLHSCLFLFGLGLDIPIFLWKKKKSLHYFDYKSDTCSYCTINTIDIKEKMKNIFFNSTIKNEPCECFGCISRQWFFCIYLKYTSTPPLPTITTQSQGCHTCRAFLTWRQWQYLCIDLQGSDKITPLKFVPDLVYTNCSKY